ncbi:MAG: metallophosphoesterase [Rickettsiales bacterium]|nr:metallophosphoesterase [Rickettsiales bacterium]
MKLLFIGDIVGRTGRDAVTRLLPGLRDEFSIDATIVNVDNAAGGFGVTKEVCSKLFDAGATALTTGDHLWDQKGMPELLEKESRLLRPHNFPSDTPGSGCRLFTLPNGKRLLILHLLGQVFHREYLDSPFRAAVEALKPYDLGRNVDAIFVDMHAEATSEKNAMGVFLDGGVSAVIGSHTHIPTADARILAKGTAYQTDAGMCGDYANTIIGFQPEAPMQQFWGKYRKIRMEPGIGPGTVCGCVIDVGENGLAQSITPIQRMV